MGLFGNKKPQSFADLEKKHKTIVVPVEEKKKKSQFELVIVAEGVDEYWKNCDDECPQCGEYIEFEYNTRSKEFRGGEGITQKEGPLMTCDSCGCMFEVTVV